ncbi:hypothetical protein XHV734_4767 [Xanthomonas hortorum pv. vitians]|nr:hypothetical protein XHV734_4767 [Xanthomonas hortorum pv. vitians]
MTAGEPKASGARQLGHRPGSRVTVAGHEKGSEKCVPTGDPGGGGAQSARLSRLGQCLARGTFKRACSPPILPPAQHAQEGAFHRDGSERGPTVQMRAVVATTVRWPRP